jgi:hypothetical protein
MIRTNREIMAFLPLWFPMHLAGVRGNGSTVRVSGLSTGTADQLYLALRIAGVLVILLVTIIALYVIVVLLGFVGNPCTGARGSMTAAELQTIH